MLKNYYVYPTCAPTRSAFMTGRHATHTGIYDTYNMQDPKGVPLSETFVPQVLEKAGYACHAIGKWHLGYYRKEYTPTFRGFQSWYGFYGWGEKYFDHTYHRVYDFMSAHEPKCGPECSKVEWGAYDNYSTYLFTDRAISIVEKHPITKPLFLYLAWQAVHGPSDAPVEELYDSGERDKVFAAMLTAADTGIGQVMNAFEERDMLANTLIIFTTDNGGPVIAPEGGEDACGSSNYPLRGGKHTLFDGGVRGIAMVWAGWTKLPMQYLGLMAAVDWLPTLAAVAGIEVPQTTGKLDGVNQWAAIQEGGVTTPYGDTPVLVAFQQGGYAVRWREWKLIQGRPVSWSDNAYGWSAPSGDNTTHFKMPKWDKDTVLLYNVRDDEGEHNDVAEENPDVVSHMTESLNLLITDSVPHDHAEAQHCTISNGQAPKRVNDASYISASQEYNHFPLQYWGPWPESLLKKCKSPEQNET